MERDWTLKNKGQKTEKIKDKNYPQSPQDSGPGPAVSASPSLMNWLDMQIHLYNRPSAGGVNNLCFNKSCWWFWCLIKMLEDYYPRTHLKLFYGNSTQSNIFSPRLVVLSPNLSEGIVPGYRIKHSLIWSSHRGSADTNLTSIHVDTGSIAGLTQWVKDPALPWAVV